MESEREASADRLIEDRLSSALAKAAKLRELLETGAPQEELLGALDGIIIDLDPFAAADTTAEASESHTEKLARLTRHTDSRVIAVVLQEGQQGLLIHPALTNHLLVTLGLSEGKLLSAKNRLVARGFLEVGYEETSGRRLINSYRVDPEVIAKAIENGDLLAIEDPTVALPHTSYVKSRGIVSPRAASPPRHRGSTAPQKPTAAGLQPGPDEETPPSPIDRLTQREVQTIIPELAPKARFVMFFRTPRAFDSTREMQLALLAETMLSWKDLREFILSSPKQNLIIIGKFNPEGGGCFGIITDQGRSFLETALHDLRNNRQNQQ